MRGAGKIEMGRALREPSSKLGPLFRFPVEGKNHRPVEAGCFMAGE
jgi:hypothetical protein